MSRFRARSNKGCGNWSALRTGRRCWRLWRCSWRSGSAVHGCSAARQGERADRIAFLFAGAQKSIALGAPLATVLFPPEIAGLLLLPVLTYHLLQLVLSAPLARRLNDPSEAALPPSAG